MSIEKIGDIEDAERYLAEDCYCPGEIYEPNNLFCHIFSADDSCTLIAKSNEKIAVVSGGTQPSFPQAIIFYYDNRKIVDAFCVSATENNIEIMKAFVVGGNVDGRSFDKFNGEQDDTALARIMELCDGIIIS